ncbi:MarR family winged helix-turn-helix transcriptional regulator [Pseudonocardia sichuanensis]|uniref:DNA-binding MarR family transcriptional regulator n=1 Tax=Pseudonocardia kunmingensis TaxID=630975 RepID=A0A543D3F7_9PSEU|nr:MarR family transcriptional regulator [Pseudonocardia kunmingensis]TQM03876.1 DNA-binding MarR family transcriptional regulator [Pseudonocardia kunmingensis]
MSDTRWLDDDEQHTWRSFLTANRLFFDGIERQLQQDSGLPHAYYEILVRLSEAPDRELRMSDLASTSLSSRSRISHAVARLEESGWVRRRPCADDRRGAIAELTDEGLARLQAVAPAHVEAVRRGLFDALSAEQVAALRDISDTLVSHLSDVPVWPAADDPATTARDRR